MPEQPPIEAVLDAYRTVLERPEVSPTDDFFALGGDSMQALDVIALVEEALGSAIGVSVFFGNPTPAELAEAISATSGATP